MKKKILLLVAIATMTITLTSCQSIARHWGGTAEIDLEPGQKLMEATWKDDDSLWYLTRPMRDGEVAETLTFQQSTDMGIIEGQVIFHEHEEDKQCTNHR